MLIRLRQVLVGSLLLVLAIFLYEQKRRKPVATQALAAVSRSQLDLSRIPKAAAQGAEAVGLSAVAPVSSSEQERSEQAEWRQEMREFNSYHSASGMHISRLLRKQHQAGKLGRYFSSELRALGASDDKERDQLVLVANALQGPELLNFWQDLALRETPRFPLEASVRQPQHPDLASRSIHLEQLMAIRNIGLIAGQEPRARQLLVKIIAESEPDLLQILHREQAFVSLREADPALALRVLKSLSTEDPLRRRLRDKLFSQEK